MRLPKFPWPGHELQGQPYKPRRKCLLAESVASVCSAAFGFQLCGCETCHTCVQANDRLGQELNAFAFFPLTQYLRSSYNAMPKHTKQKATCHDSRTDYRHVVVRYKQVAANGGAHPQLHAWLVCPSLWA